MTSGLIIYAVIAGSLLLTLWKYPAVALAGVLCLYGLEQWGQATTPFLLQHHSATNYLIGGILLLALLVQGVKKGFSLLAGYPAVGWLTLALFLYAFVSMQWAPRSDISLALWASHWPYVITFIVLSPLLIAEARDLRVAYAAMILVGGILTFLLLFFVKWESRRIVLDHDFGNPLAVAAMAGIVALAAMLADPWPFSKTWKVAKWAIVALCLIFVVKSGSRGQLLALIGLTAVCWPISRRMENLKQFVIWIGPVLFLIAITNWALQEFWSEQQRYYAGGNRWSEQAMEGAMSGRFDQGLYLVRLWFNSPETIIFGLGNSASSDPHILGIYPHFVPLEILAEEGLIGFAIFGAILYLTTRNALQCYRHVRLDPQGRSVFAALLAMFLYTLLLAFKQGSLLGNLDPFMFAIMLGKYVKLCTSNTSQVSSIEFVEEPAPKIFGRYPVMR